jgi:hypothetical protein
LGRSEITHPLCYSTRTQISLATMFDLQRIAPLISAVQRIQTSSVIAPLLAVLVITGVIALFGSLILSGALLVGIWALFGVSVLFTLAAYSYWSAKEPNRLQTENYQLAQQRFLIGDERDPNSIKMIESQPTANTALRQ